MEARDVQAGINRANQAFVRDLLPVQLWGTPKTGQ
jgi:hypothetical protein